MKIEIKKIFQAKSLSIIAFCLAGLLILLIVLKVGIIIGASKANFSHRWSDNYQRNFAGPRGGFPTGFGDRDFMEAHGIFGQIIKIDPSTSSGQALSTTSPQGAVVVIRGRGDMEKLVLLNETSVVKRFKETIKSTELKVNDFIVVIGQPNDAGQIEAKLVRVMPAPPELQRDEPPLPQGKMPPGKFFKPF